MQPGPRCLAAAKCCVPFASSGVIFLAFIGTLLNKQPLYVIGVDKPSEAAKQCFAAAWMYITIVILSVVTLAWDKLQQRDRPKSGFGVPAYGAIGGAVNYKNEL
mmetsp:Transcript_13014/g.40115  ORF Transcript_13014/g.40115 Transcript_13014/m.40115 type:complete len:104 (-) Transcript_13014:41-352(-)